jgi:hypothetical protein
MTLAPAARATLTESSVEPLSTTTTSPDKPMAATELNASSMQAPIASSSLRQGMTTDTSMDLMEWATPL